jgi:indolepyruvate ferredoxin oxidoreductase
LAESAGTKERLVNFADFDLDAKYRQVSGTILLSGIQALVRLPIDQHRADAAKGLRTATFISGYQGSPLGTLDLTIERMLPLLAEHDVNWVPGINEDLAATAVWGSQQQLLGPLADHDGVLGMWYGKGPGVDRCGDVFKHANFMGVGERGGVLAIGGDDPMSKSSTLPTDTQLTFYDSLFPVLYPGTIQEVLDLGLHGFALSRYSGLWVGFKIVTNVADGLATAEVAPDRVRVVDPGLEIDGSPWRHVQRPGLLAPISLEQEKEIHYGRLEAAKAYAAANRVNEIAGATGRARLGIVAAGRTYREVCQALSDLGLGESDLRHAGIRLLRLGMVFPVEPGIVREFAKGLEEIVVVEEKRPFIEIFVRDILYPLSERPRVVGARDQHDRVLVPADGELTADRLAPILAGRLGERLTTPAVTARLALLEAAAASIDDPLAVRTPYFCSGCPHNRSTQVPDDAVVGAGVGCHAMVLWMDRGAVGISHMGGEGSQWIGRAPFTDRAHMFQNIGDGTFFHSGSLSIRAAVAAGVNITYKLLYNRAVAMTGGQDVAGVMEVPELTRGLAAEGVRRVIVCSDEPDKFGSAADWAPNVDVWERDRLDEAQRVLRETPGVTVIVYDQQCAAEKRRDRKRGKLATPSLRVLINESVCEGCGDCGVKSNCLSVHPVQTELGQKAQIHQSSCNFDYTCVEGDCPSFVKVETNGATPRPRRTVPAASTEIADPAACRLVGGSWAVAMAGVGGTGVVTANQVLATAALLDGYDVSGLDQTGLSQKGGPVFSHVRILDGNARGSSAIGVGHADCYLGFDVLVAADPKNLVRARPDRTVAIVSTSEVPTGEMVAHHGASFPDVEHLVSAIAAATRSDENVYLDANGLSDRLFGDHMQANFIVLGAAYQAGLLPVSAASIQRAIHLNGVAVDANTQAFRWGRHAVANPDAVSAATRPRRPGAIEIDPPKALQQRAEGLVRDSGLTGDVARLAALRAAELFDYQSERLARTYVDLVARTARREADMAADETRLSEAVARYYFKLLAYKDEYEVARLHLRPEFERAVAEAFPPGSRISYQLHPPFLRAMGLERKLSLGPWSRPALRLLRSMRRVRGTRLDLFGYARLRRLERRLVEEYRVMVQDELESLSPGTYERAVRLASLPDVIRGYEGVKLRNVEHYRAEVENLRNPVVSAVTPPDATRRGVTPAGHRPGAGA